MIARITILEPTAEFKEDITSRVPDIKGIGGKVIAFVSNVGWRCLPIIWERLNKLLLDRHEVSETFQVPVPQITPAAPEVLDEVAHKAHAAIVGLAN